MTAVQFDDAVSPFYSDCQLIVSNYFKKQGAKKLLIKNQDLFELFLGQIFGKKMKRADIMKKIWSAEPLHI